MERYIILYGVVGEEEIGYDERDQGPYCSTTAVSGTTTSTRVTPVLALATLAHDRCMYDIIPIVYQAPGIRVL